MSDTLFDPGPGREPQPKLSPDQQRTQRRRDQLAAGIHPTTGRRLMTKAAAPPGVPESVLVCGECAHCFEHRTNRSYFKCERASGGLAHGPGSDVRVSWPACDLWEKRP